MRSTDVSRETFTKEIFADHFGVSRETMARFEIYGQMLSDWQERMNLVGPATLPDMWGRHFADSAQLHSLVSFPSIDLGSGAGFPGLVLSILTGERITLVEATAKKVDFLRAVIAATSANATIAHTRIEVLEPLTYPTIIARACAPLMQLFEWGLRFAGPRTRWVLPKGARAADEITAARATFRFDAKQIPSITDPSARIIVATNVGRR